MPVLHGNFTVVYMYGALVLSLIYVTPHTPPTELCDYLTKAYACRAISERARVRAILRDRSVRRSLARSHGVLVNQTEGALLYLPTDSCRALDIFN